MYEPSKHSRDHIEEVILARLSVQLPDDLTDDEIEPIFKSLSPVLDVVMNKILWTTTIPMFTNEDLISFMYLKTHQILRRQKWNMNRSPYSFFYTAFKHLIRDIIKMQRAKHMEHMRWDMLDVVVGRHFDETLLVSYESMIDDEFELADVL